MKGISGIKKINLKYKLFNEMLRLPLFLTAAGASSDEPPASRRGCLGASAWPPGALHLVTAVPVEAVKEKDLPHSPDPLPVTFLLLFAAPVMSIYGN